MVNPAIISDGDEPVLRRLQANILAVGFRGCESPLTHIL